MESRGVTEWMAGYIETQGFSTREIARKLKISERKLKGRAARDLNAEEFLELCCYLQITPEQIRRLMGTE